MKVEVMKKRVVVLLCASSFLFSFVPEPRRETLSIDDENVCQLELLAEQLTQQVGIISSACHLFWY